MKAAIVMAIVALCVFIAIVLRRLWVAHRPMSCPRCSATVYDDLVRCSRADCPVLNYHDGPKTLQ